MHEKPGSPTRINIDNDIKYYFGPENKWKLHLYHHQSTNNIKYKNCTTLSKYFRQLKNNYENLSISWEIHAKANTYYGKGERFNLCVLEKLILKYLNTSNLLNKKKKKMN